MSPSTESDQLLSHFVYPPGSVELLDFQSDLPRDWPESLLQLSTQLQHLSDVFFGMMLQETESLSMRSLPPRSEIEARVLRILRYFDLFVQTYSELAGSYAESTRPVSLPDFFPGSGKVSLRFRMLEIALVPVQRLVHMDFKHLGNSDGIDQMLSKAHWNDSNSLGKDNPATYSFLLEFARQKQDLNLWQRLKKYDWEDSENLGLKRALRQLDEMANLSWPSSLMHVWRGIVGAGSTGGIHQIPRLSRVIFFPDLWLPEELDSWGKIAPPKATVNPF
jgi:tryptophan 2,3-dioxygenase